MSDNNLHEAQYENPGQGPVASAHDPVQDASWEAVSHDPHATAPHSASAGNPATGGPEQTGLNLSYEQARDQLVEVVRQLEAGQGGLEDSLKLWERGEALAAHCQAWLDGAQNRLDQALAARQNQQ